MTLLARIRSVIGENARPSGMLRVRHLTPTTSRLEQQWHGSYGTIWAEVPHVDATGKIVIEPTTCAICGHPETSPHHLGSAHAVPDKNAPYAPIDDAEFGMKP